MYKDYQQRMKICLNKEEYNIDIAALTKTKKKGKGTEEKQVYLHIFSRVPIRNKLV